MNHVMHVVLRSNNTVCKRGTFSIVFPSLIVSYNKWHPRDLRESDVFVNFLSLSKPDHVCISHRKLLRLLSTGSVFVKSQPFSEKFDWRMPLKLLWTVIRQSIVEKTDSVCYPAKFTDLKLCRMTVEGDVKWRPLVKSAETDPVDSSLYAVSKWKHTTENMYVCK